MSKKQLGQFFTTNSNYILQNLEKYIKNKKAAMLLFKNCLNRLSQI